MAREEFSGMGKRVVKILQVKVLPANSFEDVQYAIDKVCGGEPLIVSCAEIDEKSTQRFLDLMSGAIYAINGKILQLNQRDFLFIPPGVEVVKD